MTPPLLNSAPVRAHRRRIPPTPSQAHAARAEQHRVALAAREPVVVSVDGHGRGWYVAEVGDGVYHLWRDGVRATAAWTDVPLGQQ